MNALEAFTQYAELLRHFYSILGRTGSQAAVPGSSSEEKAKKILKRLHEIHEHLDATKRSLGGANSGGGGFGPQGSFDAVAVNAQAKCIADIQQLRVQAVEVWKRHCANYSARPR